MTLVTGRPWYKKIPKQNFGGGKKKSYDLESKVYKLGRKENRKISKRIAKCKD